MISLNRFQTLKKDSIPKQVSIIKCSCCSFTILDYFMADSYPCVRVLSGYSTKWLVYSNEQWISSRYHHKFQNIDELYAILLQDEKRNISYAYCVLKDYLPKDCWSVIAGY
jgi:hypothetical protein